MSSALNGSVGVVATAGDAAAKDAIFSSPMEQFDVFLSCAWGAEEPGGSGLFPLQAKALTVADALRAAGLDRIWINTDRLASADDATDLPAAIALAIQSSRVVVLCVADEYASSRRCRLEAQYATRSKKGFFAVNVGQPGYEVGRYADGDAHRVAWLDILLLNRHYADAKTPERAAGPGGFATLVKMVQIELERAPGLLPLPVSAVEALVKRCFTPAINEASASILGLELHAAMKAKKNASEESLRLMAERADLTVRDEFGNAALSLACAFSLPETALAIISVVTVAEVDARDNIGRTPLMLASWRNLVPVIATLLAKGASIDAVDKSDQTALYHACLTSSVDAALHLIAAGADVSKGRSALRHCSSRVEMAAVVQAIKDSEMSRPAGAAAAGGSGRGTAAAHHQPVVATAALAAAAGAAVTIVKEADGAAPPPEEDLNLAFDDADDLLFDIERMGEGFFAADGAKHHAKAKLAGRKGSAMAPRGGVASVENEGDVSFHEEDDDDLLAELDAMETEDKSLKAAASASAAASKTSSSSFSIAASGAHSHNPTAAPATVASAAFPSAVGGAISADSLVSAAAPAASSPHTAATISWSSLSPALSPPPASPLSSSSSSAAAPPFSFSRHLLLQGSAGIVFHASWKRTPRAPPVSVAVKLLKAAALSGLELRDAVAALEIEAAAMAAANGGAYAHPHVAVLYGLARGPPTAAWLDALGVHSPALLVGSSGSSAGEQLLFGLVTRWEAGGSLHELLHGGSGSGGGGAPIGVGGATRGGAWWASTSTATRLRLVADLADGLAHLHGGDPCVLHGDIKPENVLLSEPVAAATSSSAAAAPPRPVLVDFGLAATRALAATAGSRVSTALVASAANPKRGTWPYMAPEMLEQEDDSVAPLGPSRSTDVYALATLAWEALTGALPWAGLRENKRAMAAWRGRNLPLESPPLPADTPAAVRDLLARSLGPRGGRPTAAALALTLRQAAQALAAGAFDVFLSHAWAPGGVHEPLTTAVYAGLLAAGARVWIDTLEMGHQLDDSMQRGIAASAVVVALLSARYEDSANCKKELAWAKGMLKPIVACLADAHDATWFPAKDSATLDILGGAGTLFPDLRQAAAVGGGGGVEGEECGDDGAAARLMRLNTRPNALPLLLRLIREARAEADAAKAAPDGEGSEGGSGRG